MADKHVLNPVPPAIPSWLWAEASHDLRQPLQALEWIALALPATSPDELRRSADNIVQLSQMIGRMHALLAGLAVLAEGSSGRGAETATSAVALDDLSRAAIADIAELAEDRGVGISATLPAVARTVTVPGSWLQEAVTGLLLHAIKNTRGKNIAVTLQDAGELIRLDVVFEAGEISPRLLKAAFVDASYGKKPSAWKLGLGLGMLSHLARVLGIGFTRRATGNDTHTLTLLIGGERSPG